MNVHSKHYAHPAISIQDLFAHEQADGGSPITFLVEVESGFITYSLLKSILLKHT